MAIFNRFKRFLGLSSDDDSTSRPRKPTNNGGYDVYDFDNESPPKKSKQNGFFHGDQLPSPWSTESVKPSSRKPLFTMGSTSNPYTNTGLNGTVRTGVSGTSTETSAQRKQPRGRFDQPDYNRRFIGGEGPSKMSSTSSTLHFPISTGIISAPINQPRLHRSDVREVEITGGYFRPKPGAPSPASLRSRSGPSEIPSFTEFSRINTTTAAEGWEKSRQSNYPWPSVSHQLTTTQNGLTKPQTTSAWSGDRLRSESRVPNGPACSKVPLDSSYSTNLREKISGRHSCTVRVEPPRRLRSTMDVPEVITIDDSDEENVGAKRSDPAALSKSTNATQQFRERVQQISAKKTGDLSSRKPSLPLSNGLSSSEFYAGAYSRPNYVPEERRNNISQRIGERVKSFAAADVDFIPLNSDQDQFVDNALAPGRPDTEELVEAFKITIRRKDMRTLKGLTWLNDEVANFFLEMIVERSTKYPNLPKVYTFNTFFYTQLMNKGYQSLKRWTKKVDLFSHDMILVPVHMSSHWCLAVINFRDHTMKYYDSLGHENHACFKLLREYLEEESKDKKRTDVLLDWEDWKFLFAHDEDIPLQRNMSDCGVFMLKFADFVSRNKPITFSQDNMPYFRRRICLEILNKKLIGYD